MATEYRFVKEWPANTGIDRWDDGRAKLNAIITAYNEWQWKHQFDGEVGQVLYGQILCGIATFADGESYAQELQAMLEFVKEAGSLTSEASSGGSRPR